MTVASSTLQKDKHYLLPLKFAAPSSPQIEVSDERNIYISNKAKSMAFNWGILACAAATVVLRIIGMNDQSTICGLTICIVLVLYWVIYLIYNKNS